MAGVKKDLGDLAAAREYLLRAITASEESSDPGAEDAQFGLLQQLANVLTAEGHPDLALEVWSSLLREARHPGMVAALLVEMGNNQWRSGDALAAERSYREAIEIDEEERPYPSSYPYVQLAKLYEHQGRYLEAASLYAITSALVDFATGTEEAKRAFRSLHEADRCRVLALAGDADEACLEGEGGRDGD